MNDSTFQHGDILSVRGGDDGGIVIAPAWTRLNAEGARELAAQLKWAADLIKL